MCMPPMVMAIATTAVQMGSALMSGYMQSQSLKSQASQVDFQAKIARLEGERRQLMISREARRLNSSNLAAMAASGLALSSGAFEAVREANFENERRDRSIAQFNTNNQSSLLRMQAAQLRQSAGFAVTSGFIGAVSAGFQGFSSYQTATGG